MDRVWNQESLIGRHTDGVTDVLSERRELDYGAEKEPAGRDEREYACMHTILANDTNSQKRGENHQT